jgi:hypothetical protein
VKAGSQVHALLIGPVSAYSGPLSVHKEATATAIGIAAAAGVGGGGGGETKAEQPQSKGMPSMKDGGMDGSEYNAFCDVIARFSGPQGADEDLLSDHQRQSKSPHSSSLFDVDVRFSLRPLRACMPTRAGPRW